MVLEQRPDLLELQAVGIIHEHHAVRVAHAYGCHAVFRAADLQRHSDSGIALGDHRYISRYEDRRAHVHARGHSLAVLNSQLDGLDAAERLNAHRGLILRDHSVVVQILCHTAHAVAAHLSLASVGVEHPHLSVGDIGRADQYDSVAAYAEAPVGQPYSQSRRVTHLLLKCVDIYIVVADALHLGELELHYKTSGFS